MISTKIYEEYLESGLTWVGCYPKLWSLTKVKYEAIVKARVGWHGLKSDDFTDEGPYLVTGSDFKGPSISWSDCYHCDIERYEQDPYIQLRNGDLLLTKDGTIGKVALVESLKDDEKATLNSGVFVVRPVNNSFTTRFYFWLLQSKVFKDFVDFHKTGSTIVHLYQDTFVNFLYASPSFTEQTQIAAFLDYEIARIDRLIAQQQRLIELLKEKRQAVISHTVTKGLNPGVPTKDSGVEWLGQVPEHWAVGRLGYYCRVENGTTPSKSNQDYWSNGSIPWLSSGAVNQYEITEASEMISVKALSECSLRLLPKNTLVVGMIGQGKTRGMSGITRIPASINQNLAAIIPNDNVNSDFLHFVLQAAYISLRETARGGNQAALNCELIGDLRFAKPDLNNQLKIVNYLNKKRIQFDKIVDRTNTSMKLLEERRTALISAVVTGKIDLRGWEQPHA